MRCHDAVSRCGVRPIPSARPCGRPAMGAGGAGTAIRRIAPARSAGLAAPGLPVSAEGQRPQRGRPRSWPRPWPPDGACTAPRHRRPPPPFRSAPPSRAPPGIRPGRPCPVRGTPKAAPRTAGHAAGAVRHPLLRMQSDLSAVAGPSVPLAVASVVAAPQSGRPWRRRGRPTLTPTPGPVSCRRRWAAPTRPSGGAMGTEKGQAA